MINVRRSKNRGHANHGWLDSYHTFSFGEFMDADFMGFRSLRVINEDNVAPDMGFGSHPHRDMEILSYVITGELKHQDNMGNTSVIKAGNLQKITAGTGITHSEFNPSTTTSVHFLQIWIIPRDRGLKPSYQEQSLSPTSTNSLVLVGSSIPTTGVIEFNQDVDIYRGTLSKGTNERFVIRQGRGVWIQMIKGTMTVNDQELFPSDGAAIEGLNDITITPFNDVEFLLFDLA